MCYQLYYFGIESVTFSQAAITIGTTAGAENFTVTTSTGTQSIAAGADATEFASNLQAATGGANVSTLQLIDKIDITSVQGAEDAIKIIDGAIAQIDSLRDDLGAVMNRFESSISNLRNVSENLSAARSRILDADIAQETSAMTKNNILQQAGVSILAQANQAPQLALQLLKG